MYSRCDTMTEVCLCVCVCHSGVVEEKKRQLLHRSSSSNLHFSVSRVLFSFSFGLKTFTPSRAFPTSENYRPYDNRKIFFFSTRNFSSLAFLRVDWEKLEIVVWRWWSYEIFPSNISLSPSLRVAGSYFIHEVGVRFEFGSPLVLFWW